MRCKNVMCERFNEMSRQIRSSSSSSPRGSLRRKSNASRCVWRYELKKLATSTNLLHKTRHMINIDAVDDVLSSHESGRADAPPSAALFNRIDMNTHQEQADRKVSGIDLIVEAILTDKSSFACIVLNAFLPKLFATITQVTDNPVPRQSVSQYQELLKHSRQCLDALSLAVVASFPVDSETTMDSVLLTSVVNASDAFALLKFTHQNRILYDLLMSICSMACEAQDSLLLRWLASRSQVSAHHTDALVVDRFANIFAKSTGLDKLKSVVSAFHMLTYGIQESSAAASESEHSETAAMVEIGADLLLGLVHQALADYMLSQTPHEPIDPQRLNWSAQCMFMSLMTAEIPTYTVARQADYLDATVMAEGGWTLGAEGYALATLQTALYALTSQQPNY